MVSRQALLGLTVNLSSAWLPGQRRDLKVAYPHVLAEMPGLDHVTVEVRPCGDDGRPQVREGPPPTRGAQLSILRPNGQLVLAFAVAEDLRRGFTAAVGG